jgi:hypothetical protein
MGTVGSRPRRRIIGGVAILLLTWPAPAAPTMAGHQPGSERATAPLVDHHGEATADPRKLTVRRINVSELTGSIEAPRGEPAPSAGATPAHRSTVAADIEAAPPADLGTTNGSAAPILGRLGLTEGHANTPNPMVAVGPDDVIRSDGGVMRLTNRTGGAAAVISYADFFANGMAPGINHKQGQIYFDPVHGRWIAIDVDHYCSAGNLQYNSWLNFAVSMTADPWWEWDLYSFSHEGNYLFDPGFGTSGDKLVLTSRFHAMGSNCSSSGGDSWDATTIGWIDLSFSDFYETYFVFAETSQLRVDKLVPAVRRDGASNTLDVLAMVSDKDTLDQTTSLWRFTGPGASTTHDPVGLSPDVIPDLGTAIHIPQGDSGFTPASGPTSVVAQDERLVFTSTEPCMPAGDTTARNCARIVDLDTSTQTPTRLQDFFIGRTGRHVFSPAADFSATGDLYVTYQRASDTAGPSSHVVKQSPTDPPGSISASQTLASSLSFYQNLNAAERIGLSPDPQVPDAVWVINQSGKSTDPDAYNLQVAQARTATGDTYVPIEPLRVLDTRDGTGLSGGFQGDVPRTFNVAGAFGGAIPDDAVAITGNVTVAAATNPGYVSVSPSIPALLSIYTPPATSTINFPGGDNRANNVTLPLNADGDLMAVFIGVGGRPHLILDVTGYFLADETGATYEPITAARVLDTRVGTGLSGKFVVNVPRPFQVSGHGGVPAGAVAVTGNLTVVGQTKAGYVTLAPEPDATPATSTINFPLGDTRANGATVPLSATGSLSAVFKASGGSTDLIFDVTGYYVDDDTGLRFYPLTPGRIMDTRFSALTQLYGPFTNSVPRTLVTGGHFGVPPDALAVTGNLTVVGPTKAGYISITKNPTTTPPVSTLNFPFGDVRANGVTVPLNAANDMALVYKATSGAKTHLILDMTGYFK